MYDKSFGDSLAAVESAREENLLTEPAKLRTRDKKLLLKNFHPDYMGSAFSKLLAGSCKDFFVPKELAELLHGKSHLDKKDIDLSGAELVTDVLVIGGGGAGAAAAIEAKKAGAKVTLVTKLRFGDSNTIMAEGGIQAADKPNDSPSDHFIDAYGGGHYSAKKPLLSKMVADGPEAIRWLEDLGVEFDKEPVGTMITNHGGGTSRKRMHSAKDYTGLEIMRTLRDEVINLGVQIIEYTAAVEILTDEKGRAAGAVLMNMDDGRFIVARAGAVIIATGGSGRLHYQGFPTSNHYGATADGLIIGYRAGAKLIYADSMQYHPTGVAYPFQIFGSLVTEKVRSLGAKPVNKYGKLFIHPLETRDVLAAAIIRECTECGSGVETANGSAVWLDTPMIELIHGSGTIEKSLPAMLRMFASFGIDIRKEPILVYPTLHYQNGGLDIDTDAMTCVENLYAAGEVTGGIHGRNRLMGNSLLDIIVFGRIAGKNAAKKALSDRSEHKLSLAHLKIYDDELKSAGVGSDTTSPMLLPDYSKK